MLATDACFLGHVTIHHLLITGHGGHIPKPNTRDREAKPVPGQTSGWAATLFHLYSTIACHSQGFCGSGVTAVSAGRTRRS